MLSLFRFAAILFVSFAACGFPMAEAQPIAPAGSGVTINKLVIENGPIRTVKYTVTGGSPRLQALVRRVEWAENELGVVEQMQMLKLDTIVQERQLTSFRTAQLTNPYFPLGYGPLVIGGNNGYYQSSLQNALGFQLAYEATPQAALQLIGYLEKMQTDLDAELKALAPQEKKAVEGVVDALRPKLAALPHSDVAIGQPQQIFPRPNGVPSPAVPNQPATPTESAALMQTVQKYQETVRQQILQLPIVGLNQ